MKMNWSEAVIAFLIVAILALVLFGATGLVLKIAWNYVAPVFGLPIIGFWHAVAILIVLALIGGAVRGSRK